MSTSTTAESSKRHAATPLDKQRAQLEKLLKDPSKPAFIPPPPKEKTIRPAREMMKNVQGSSAGAGSGEFHVYKASRRREYERLKVMEDQSKKVCSIRLIVLSPGLTLLQEADQQEYEQRKQEREQVLEAKTAKNRAKRQKKKEKAKAAANETPRADGKEDDGPVKKRRLVNGKELVFKKRDDRESDDEEIGPLPGEGTSMTNEEDDPSMLMPAPDVAKITVHEDD